MKKIGEKPRTMWVLRPSPFIVHMEENKARPVSADQRIGWGSSPSTVLRKLLPELSVLDSLFLLLAALKPLSTSATTTGQARLFFLFFCSGEEMAEHDGGSGVTACVCLPSPD